MSVLVVRASFSNSHRVQGRVVRPVRNPWVNKFSTSTQPCRDHSFFFVGVGQGTLRHFILSMVWVCVAHFGGKFDTFRITFLLTRVPEGVVFHLLSLQADGSFSNLVVFGSVTRVRRHYVVASSKYLLRVIHGGSSYVLLLRLRRHLFSLKDQSQIRHAN